MLKLVAIFTTGIPALFAMIVAHFGRKFTTITSTFIAMGLMLVVFISCINLILQSVLNFIAIPNWILVPLGMFIPVNFAAILSAIVSAKICRAAYDFMSKKVDIAAKAN